MNSTTLHNIAKEIAVSKHDTSGLSIPEFIMYGKDAIVEMNLRGFMPIQSVALDIEKHSAKLPEDFLRYVKVGICICNHIVELDYDETLCVREPKDDFCASCGDTEVPALIKQYYKIETKVDGTRSYYYTETLSSPNGATIAVTANNPQYVCSYTLPVIITSGAHKITLVGDCPATDGDEEIITEEPLTSDQVFDAQCGCISAGCIPNGFGGYYDWDNIEYKNRYLEAIPTFPAYVSRGRFKIQNGRIYLDSICSRYADKVVLQYKSTGVSDSGKTEVPYILKPTIKAFIQWQIELNRDKPMPGMIDTKKREFLRQKNLVKSNDILKSILEMLKVQMSHTYVANLSR